LLTLKTESESSELNCVYQGYPAGASPGDTRILFNDICITVTNYKSDIMKTKNPLVVVLAVILLISPILTSGFPGVKPDKQSIKFERKKTALFNGKDLTNWEFFLRKATVDPAMVFTVQNGLIHFTPYPWGYMRTKESYSDYKLHVEWRWPVEATNSGVFIHYVPRDSTSFTWIECQLGAGNAGDFICERGIDMDERINKAKGGVKKLAESSEKKTGEWNTMEVICIGNSIKVFVNGVLQNTGTNVNVSNGSIGLQVEGKEIEFRNVYIRKQKK
jgi:hypothetical protein